MKKFKKVHICLLTPFNFDKFSFCKNLFSLEIKYFNNIPIKGFEECKFINLQKLNCHFYINDENYINNFRKFIKLNQ